MGAGLDLSRGLAPDPPLAPPPPPPRSTVERAGDLLMQQATRERRRQPDQPSWPTTHAGAEAMVDEQIRWWQSQDVGAGMAWSALGNGAAAASWAAVRSFMLRWALSQMRWADPHIAAEAEAPSTR